MGQKLLSDDRSPRREGDIITKSPTQMDYHNTYNIIVLYKVKTGNCRTLSLLSITVLLVREMSTKLRELEKKQNIVQEVGSVTESVPLKISTRASIFRSHPRTKIEQIEVLNDHEQKMRLCDFYIGVKFIIP